MNPCRKAESAKARQLNGQDIVRYLVAYQRAFGSTLIESMQIRAPLIDTSLPSGNHSEYQILVVLNTRRYDTAHVKTHQY
jgi:hypothetical protein